jgi:hypothetical protein
MLSRNTTAWSCAGKGKMRFKDGGYYEGDFKNDEMTGQGTRRFANGSTFIGEVCVRVTFIGEVCVRVTFIGDGYR